MQSTSICLSVGCITDRDDRDVDNKNSIDFCRWVPLSVQLYTIPIISTYLPTYLRYLDVGLNGKVVQC